MKVCKKHNKRDCPTCHTGAYETPTTSPASSAWLYTDVSSYNYSDSSSSSCDTSSSSYSDSGGSGSCD